MNDAARSARATVSPGNGTGRGGAGAGPIRRARRAGPFAAVLAAAAGAAVLTGCSGSAIGMAGRQLSPPSDSVATANAGPVVTAVPTVLPRNATPVPLPAPSSAPTGATVPQPSGPQPSAPPGSVGPAGAVPVLGRLAGDFAQATGFGRVKPRKIFNGGDPTGLVTKVAWQSWGGAQATGTGLSDYVGPGQSVATGSQEPATVVAFNLGICHGVVAYKAVEWYFGGEGQSFDPSHYENICAGSYVPTP